MARCGRRRPSTTSRWRTRGGPAPIRHHRIGRRRQEHADRSSSLRHPAALRRSTEAPRSRPAPRGRRDGPLTRDRRAAGRARAGHHHRRRLPLRRHPDPQIHDRRLPRPRAVHGNMATGASTADLALVLVDGTGGLREQPAATPASRRCSGVDQLVVCANKMDLVGGIGRRTSARRRDGSPRPPARDHVVHRHPDLGPARRQRGGPVGRGPLVRRPHRAGRAGVGAGRWMGRPTRDPA